MKLRTITNDDLVQTYELLAINGWNNRISSIAELSTLLAASQIAIVAIEDNEIVGFIRAITDGKSNGYISMLVVAEPYRRQGIGRALVEHTLGTNKKITWVLRAGRDGAEEFFRKLGFEPSKMAMEKRRS
jgi:ribosomal protein S18 acetylase RimI-like enzyme